MKSITRSIFACLLISLMFAVPATAQNLDGQAYVIQTNDNLWKLADKYLGDGNAYPQIISATADKAADDTSFNVITNPNIIAPGQKIWIPTNLANIAETSIAETEASEPTDAVIAVEPIDPPASDGLMGRIAFSFWNDHADRCTYEVNVIDVNACLTSSEQCQANRRIMPLNNISEPALSPDGTRLAFRGWGDPPSESSPYLGCAAAHPHRFLGNATLDGTDFTGTGGFWEDAHPDWSPDGNRIIFDSSRNGDEVTRIYAIGADGSGEQDLRIIGQQPTWGPDNHQFVYRGCDVSGNRCGLWLALAFEAKSWEPGINLVSPVVQADQVAHPDWSPTRDEIVYQRNENGNWNLWVVNIDGSNNRRLTADSGIEGLPSWSPDGNWVAYVTHDGQDWGLYMVSRDGSAAQLLFRYDGGTYTPPIADEPYGVRDWVDEQVSWSE